MMVHTMEAFSQFLDSVGSTKARMKVIRYRPTRIMTPARARIRFSFLDMTVLPFRMILPAYKYKGKPQEKSCSPDTGADLRVAHFFQKV